MLRENMEEMFAVALILMATGMSAFVVYIMVTYETEPLGMIVQAVVLIALILIVMGECYREIRRIKKRKEGDGRQ